MSSLVTVQVAVPLLAMTMFEQLSYVVVYPATAGSVTL